MELKVKELKEVKKTDDAGETSITYQYVLEDVNDDETKMTIKTDATVDFLNPSSTVELKAMKTQTTIETHADK